MPSPSRPAARDVRAPALTTSSLTASTRAYSHKSTRRELRRRRLPHTIPEKSDQVAWRQRQGSRGGRPPNVDREKYRDRNVVERCFNRLKQHRALATRYAKRASLYRALAVIACTLIWLK